jgi:UDP-N-acetylmuramoyl-tripeptide--D-alanyl-D-alanine ligase
MTRLWNLNEICDAVNGTCSGNWSADSVVIDSRNAAKGALFVALTTGATDGHEYVQAAIDAGAAGALVGRYVDGVPRAQQILVADTEKALQQLGVAARLRSKATMIGVTGSVGKTGCKEMLNAALSACGKCYATSGNYNNHLGVPLTLANMPLDADYAVIEMGMNHAGEIAMLSKWVKPHVSIITTVDAVHIENFENVAAIADAKSEIFSGMAGQGVAVLNADNPYFEQCKANAEGEGIDRILSFGTSEAALCRMLHYAIEDMHALVDATITGTDMRYRIGAIGKHWALMSVAVLAMVEAVHGDMAKAAAALEFFVEPKGRGQIRKLAVKGGHLRLVDDSYNASPISMEGAFEKMATLRAASKEPVRTLVVLGDMLELGENSEDLHVGLVPSIINNQMDLVFAAGEFMEKLYLALPEPLQGGYRLTSEELAPDLVRALKPHDLVLVKGSRGSKMETVVEAMEENARRVEAGEG